MKNNKIRIAIIDSGIDKTHPRLKNVNFIEEVNFTETPGFIIKDGHGTSICDRIKKTLEKEDALCDYEFYDLKVFTTKDQIKEESIFNALKYCIKRKINIINLSIGIISQIAPPEKLYQVCNEVVGQGIILIAAADNFGNVCYPADFKFVCGVSAGVIENNSDFGYDTATGHFIGKGDMQRLADLHGKCAFRAGTSYAVGQITGLLALYMRTDANRKFSAPELIESFKEKHKKGIRIINSETSEKMFTSVNILSKTEISKSLLDLFPEDKFSWINNVAIYPFSNKEFGGLRLWGEQFKYNIAEIFDFPLALLTNKQVDVAGRTYDLKLSVSGIKNNFDTFILGYPENIASTVNIRYFDEILTYINENRLNVFSFDPKVHSEILKLNNIGKTYCPIVRKEQLQKAVSLNSLGKIKKPVLGVVGTSSKTGKFSIQLKARQLLTEKGYSVGWLSTEPQGELFGADFSFPYGYSPSVELSVSTWTTFVRGIIKGIEYTRKPNIIISGHQSGLFVADSCQLNNFAFIAGVAPDAVICSITVNDSMEYIERMVYSMRYFYNIPILFLVLSEIRRDWIKDESGQIIVQERLCEKEEWNVYAERINAKFNIPVLNAYDSSHDDLFCNKIIDFYT